MAASGADRRLEQEGCSMNRHILVPTDGTDFSNQAVSHAAALAKAVGASVTVLTVTEPFHIFTLEAAQVEDTRPDYESHMRARAEAVLGKAADVVTAAGVRCDTVHMTADHPHQAIIEEAGRRGCDLVVMASHGRRGMAAVVIGSETAKVLTHSAIPVLVVRPGTAAA
jgi:nucleotide-binding universal stress UspA family protein